MNQEEVWEMVLKRIGEKISRMEFLTWFKKVSLKEISGDSVLIGCPTEMSKNWLTDKYQSIILLNVKKLLPEIEKIYFEVDLSLSNNDKSDNSDLLTRVSTPRKMPNRPEVKIEPGIESRITHSKFTLSNYIVGDENQFTHAACMAVAEQPLGDPRKYNPLFIYGGVGLGKTHLLQATANEIKRRHPSSKVVYTTAERFMNDIIQAIKNRKIEEFRKKYRRIDALLIDDIQFFEGREKTQEELFNTFNDLFEFNKQIIFSADRPPSQLEGITDRLTSRMGWGLLSDVQMPGFETRMAILQEKAQVKMLLLPIDVQEFIAENIRKNLRELENILNKIDAEQEISGIAPTVQSVARIFRQANPDEALLGSPGHKGKGSIRTIDDVIDAVSDYFQIPATEILGTSRKKEIVFARQLCWMIAKEYLKMSYEAIGIDFGGKNHTTIMHGLKKIKKLIQTDSATARHMKALKKDLGLR